MKSHFLIPMIPLGKKKVINLIISQRWLSTTTYEMHYVASDLWNILISDS